MRHGTTGLFFVLPRALAVAALLATPAAAKGPPPSKAEIDKQLQTSQEAYVNGEYDKSRSLARHVLDIEPDNARAWRLVGASSCQLKDRESALAAWNRVGEPEKKFIAYVCQRSGVTVP